MVELIGKTDGVASEAQELGIEEIKDEKSIGLTKNIKNQLGCSKIEKTADINNIKRCEFVYERSYTKFTEGVIHNKGDQCSNKAILKPDSKYCVFHKWSSQAKKVEKGRKAALKSYKEYYCNPAKELTLLYGDVYTDTTNMVVQKNSDPLSDIKWIVICRSKVDQLGNRILHKLTQNFIDKLNDEREMYNYNFIIKPKLFRKTARGYSDCEIIHSPLKDVIGKHHKESIDLLSKGMLGATYYMNYRIQRIQLHIPYKELINESEYEEWFG